MLNRRRCKITIAAAMAVATALSFSAISQAKVVEKIVAVVNGDIITETDLSRYENGSYENIRQPGLTISHEAKRKVVLDDLIDETLLKQAVAKSEIEVSDEELSRAITNVLMQNRMSLSQLQDELARKGMTYEEYKAQLRLEIKRIKFVNQVISPEVKITDRDLRDYFQKNKAELYGGTEVHIAEIVLPTGGITNQADAYALRDKAVSIVKQSREKKSAFAKLAKEHSEGPNADQGGDLGTVQLADLPKIVAGVVKRMPEGAVSDPLPTDGGIVIVKVIDWPDISDDDFNTVRDSIYQKLYETKIDDATDSYLQRLRQRAYVEVR